jgi:hypothetical protein
MIHARLVPAPPEGLTPGEAVAGMRLTGLGVAKRPWSLTSPCVASTPLALLGHDGVRAARCNRFTLGRTRDAASAEGGDLLGHARARCVCARDGSELRGTHLATTRVARRGESIPERAAQAMTSPHGESRDHRPELKPGGWEGMVAPDGGSPWVRQRGAGKPADIERFQARAQAWRAAVPQAPHPRDRLADSNLDHEEHAPHLHRRAQCRL